MKAQDLSAEMVVPDSYPFKCFNQNSRAAVHAELTGNTHANSKILVLLRLAAHIIDQTRHKFQTLGICVISGRPQKVKQLKTSAKLDDLKARPHQLEGLLIDL